MVAHQTSGAEVPGSNTASPTMILMRCRIIVYSVENLRVERETNPWGKKNIYKNKYIKYTNFPKSPKST